MTRMPRLKPELRAMRLAPTTFAWSLLTVGFAVTAASAQGADAYPSRPIRLLAPFTAGSTVDVMARVVQEQLASRLAQNLVIDNRPGANGIIATEMVAKARPDGYTMLISTGSFTGNVIATKKLPYDTVRDFAQITQIARSYGLMLVVHPGVQAQSVKELVALAKANPRKMGYASSGVGNMTHLVGELLNVLAGVELTHVPYKGSAPALTDVMGRQIEMTFISTVSVMPFIKAGRVRALALTGGERSPVMPQVPTFREAGYPEFEMTGWYGLWFPANTPATVVNRINAEIKRAVVSPEMKAKLDELGLIAVASTPPEFAKFLQEDLALQQRIAKKAGIEPQ
ncbi:MAG: tripartite tricarboxylate transporter substrate binding protein [Burkholderiales bacterium]